MERRSKPHRRECFRRLWKLGEGPRGGAVCERGESGLRVHHPAIGDEPDLAQQPRFSKRVQCGLATSRLLERWLPEHLADALLEQGQQPRVRCDVRRVELDAALRAPATEVEVPLRRRVGDGDVERERMLGHVELQGLLVAGATSQRASITDEARRHLGEQGEQRLGCPSAAPSAAALLDEAIHPRSRLTFGQRAVSPEEIERARALEEREPALREAIAAEGLRRRRDQQTSRVLVRTRDALDGLLVVVPESCGRPGQRGRSEELAD